jgi:glycosyltransferase involved in cell wall biosynthesis
MSVLDWVDQLLVFDTGSTDKTVDIIRTIKSSKIVFEQKGEVNEQKFTALRNQQLKRTKTDWVLILDGDEIWPQESIKALKQAIDRTSDEKEAVVVRYWDCLGDIYHFLAAGLKAKYPYAPEGKIGWMTIRAYKKAIPGLHCVGPYGREGYEDENSQPIQARGKERLIFLDKYYLHTTFLPRSSKDKKVMQRGPKRRFELGKAFPKDFAYPEVFNFKRPEIVPSPWTKAGLVFWAKSALLTPYFRVRRFLYQKIILPDYNPRYQRPKFADFFYQRFKKN